MPTVSNSYPTGGLTESQLDRVFRQNQGEKPSRGLARSMQRNARKGDLVRSAIRGFAAGDLDQLARGGIGVGEGTGGGELHGLSCFPAVR